MHSVLFVHPEEHNGRRFDGNKVQSLESSYQTTSYSSSFVKPGILSRQCGRSHPL